MAVDVGGDRSGCRADVTIFERLPPNREELSEDELPSGGGFDMDDAVGCVGVEVVQAAADSGCEVPVGAVLYLDLTGEADAEGNGSGLAVHVDGEVGMHMGGDLFRGAAGDPGNVGAIRRCRGGESGPSLQGGALGAHGSGRATSRACADRKDDPDHDSRHDGAAEQRCTTSDDTTACGAPLALGWPGRSCAPSCLWSR